MRNIYYFMSELIQNLFEHIYNFYKCNISFSSKKILFREHTLVIRWIIWGGGGITGEGVVIATLLTFSTEFREPW